jgi:predicted Na+-dependent transporter
MPPGKFSVRLRIHAPTTEAYRLDTAERVALAFGLGMNNNGMGLVLASLVFGDYPRVMLPIIFYNLIQHLAAGVVDRLLFDSEPNQAKALMATQG